MAEREAPPPLPPSFGFISSPFLRKFTLEVPSLPNERAKPIVLRTRVFFFNVHGHSLPPDSFVPRSLLRVPIWPVFFFPVHEMHSAKPRTLSSFYLSSSTDAAGCPTVGATTRRRFLLSPFFRVTRYPDITKVTTQIPSSLLLAHSPPLRFPFSSPGSTDPSPQSKV